MIRFSRNSIWIIFFVFVLSTVVGCANVRQKFVRKKKKEKVDSFVPVLTPEEYSNSSSNPYKAYVERYTLWRTWYNEIQVAFNYNESHKRKLYVLREAQKQLLAMHKLLPEIHREGLVELSKKMGDVLSYVDQPESMWSAGLVRRKVRMIEKNVRNQFKPTVVEEYF